MRSVLWCACLCVSSAACGASQAANDEIDPEQQVRLLSTGFEMGVRQTVAILVRAGCQTDDGVVSCPEGVRAPLVFPLGGRDLGMPREERWALEAAWCCHGLMERRGCERFASENPVFAVLLRRCRDTHEHAPDAGTSEASISTQGSADE